MENLINMNKDDIQKNSIIVSNGVESSTSPKSEISYMDEISEKDELSNISLKTEKEETKEIEEVKEIAVMEENEETEEEEKYKNILPTFPREVYEDLPEILSKAVAKGISDEDKDILLLGSIVSLSACMSNVSGIYDQREVFPNLFFFVTAKASAGKGRLALCRKLVEPIHKELLEKQRQDMVEYKSALQLFKATSSSSELGKPQEPPQKTLIIPANSSATSVFQILNDNNGVGLIFETEGDTLAHAFKSEYGNYSDGFRKAFHHETISYSRRKDKEFVELDKPKLSAVLSGTPSQVATLIPSAENGLFSRFIFYCMNIKPEWKNVFENCGEENLDLFFEKLGREFYEFYNRLKSEQVITFSITPEQQAEFNSFFSDTQKKMHCILGDEYLASVRRLGLIAFRIAMILTVLRRKESSEPSAKLVCSDRDFHTAMSIVSVLIEHATFVFNLLPAEKMYDSKGKSNKQLFLDALPKEFNRQDYLKIVENLGIKAKTAEKYLSEFRKAGLILHEGHNKYSKNKNSPFASKITW